MAKNLGKILLVVFVGILLGSFLLGVYAGYNGLEKPEVTAEYGWVVITFMTVMGVGALIYGVVWWRNVDEAVREAHKWSWYWGGSFGIVVPGVILGASYSLPTMDIFSDAFLASHGLTGFQAGILITFLPMFIGYGVAWCLWWLRHR